MAGDSETIDQLKKDKKKMEEIICSEVFAFIKKYPMMSDITVHINPIRDESKKIRSTAVRVTVEF